MSQMNQGPSSGNANQGAGRPGQMTAVMRAMAQATGPKVLRIGLVTGGKIVEERIVKQRTTVTVGPSEKSMFVTQASNIPANFKLFELIGNEYYLNFLDGMSGRVALATGITDLTALKGQARRVGNAYQVKLTDDARGKIVIGETTFLFQFVAPPPVQPRPQLPLSVKSGNQIDWNFTMICGVSLLCHVAVILVLMPGGAWFCSDGMNCFCKPQEGCGYSVRVRPPSDTDNLPVPTATAKKSDDDQGDKSEKDDKATEKPKEKPAAGTPKPANAAAPAAGMSDAKIADLQNKGAKLLLDKIAAIDGDSTDRVAGPAATNVNATGSDALKRATDGSNGSGERGAFNSGGNRGTVDPNGHHGSSDGVGTGNRTGPAGTDNSGPAPVRKEFSVGVSAAGAAQSVPVTNAEAVVRGLAGQVSFCYKQGLQRNENQSGRVGVVITVGPGGDVQGVSASNQGSLDAGVVGCVQSVVRRARFGADPNRGQATISTSFSFVKQ